MQMYLVDKFALDCALELMGKGMLGIFIVMCVISLLVWVMTKLAGKKKTGEE